MVERYLNKLKAFIVANQWKISLLTVLSAIFLYLKQTAYFNPFFEIPFAVIMPFLWICTVFFLRIKPFFSYAMAVLSLGITVVFLLGNIRPWAERSALYAYGFFVIGLLYELGLRIIKRK